MAISACFLKYHAYTLSLKFGTNILVYTTRQCCKTLCLYIRFNSISLLFRLATILTSLILLAGDVHVIPGPSQNKKHNFCHWNLGGLPTNNFLNKYLLEAFFTVNDFDI